MASSSVARVFQSNTRAPCVLALLAFRRPRAGDATERRMAMPKKRLDVLLVERGLAETRSQAQALVLAGRVLGHTKAGEQVEEATELEVEAGPRFVSRGGEKLARALVDLEIEVTGEDCLDVGASTGGFTDALLQRGARRVIALDVGYGQLHPRLRADRLDEWIDAAVA